MARRLLKAHFLPRCGSELEFMFPLRTFRGSTESVKRVFCKFPEFLGEMFCRMAKAHTVWQSISAGLSGNLGKTLLTDSVYVLQVYLRNIAMSQ